MRELAARAKDLGSSPQPIQREETPHELSSDVYVCSMASSLFKSVNKTSKDVNNRNRPS